MLQSEDKSLCSAAGVTKNQNFLGLRVNVMYDGENEDTVSFVTDYVRSTREGNDSHGESGGGGGYTVHLVLTLPRVGVGHILSWPSSWGGGYSTSCPGPVWSDRSGPGELVGIAS